MTQGSDSSPRHADEEARARMPGGRRGAAPHLLSGSAAAEGMCRKVYTYLLSPTTDRQTDRQTDSDQPRNQVTSFASSRPEPQSSTAGHECDGRSARQERAQGNSATNMRVAHAPPPIPPCPTDSCGKHCAMHLRDTQDEPTPLNSVAIRCGTVTSLAKKASRRYSTLGAQGVSLPDESNASAKRPTREAPRQRVTDRRPV
jgi:hypothetical protein